MKKFMYSLAAISAAFMAFSCAKSIEEAPVAEESVLPGRTFTCVFAQPDPDSKVALDITNGKTTWEVDDEILINAGSGGTSRRTVTLTADDISADGKTATITIPGDLDPYIHYSKGVQDVTSTYYAMYPASAVASGNLYYNQAFSNQNAFLLAACNVGDTFVFFNLNGLISYKVSGDFDSVSFSGKNGETVAYEVYQARVRDTGSGATITHAKDADTYKPLVPLTTSSTAVVSDGSTINYIYLPGGTAFSGGFTMRFIKSGDIQNVVSSSSAFTVKPGQLVNLGDISSHLLPYVAPSSHDATHPAIAGAEDLSASGTANCYMVDASLDANKEKVFKFKAVKGNSSTGVGKIDEAVVLWETYNNAETVAANSVIAQADFDKQDGDDDYWITFKMPSTLHSGNAVIAAKDDKDNILWSWHIWIPANTITAADYGIYTAGKAMHDRNLGALSVAVASNDSKIDVTSVGLVYQWGRKDPFPGPSSIETEGTYYSFATVAGTAPSAKTCQLSIEESILQPTTFAKGSNDWLSTSDGSLWGDNTSKTIYDPCPVGYRVPNRDKSNDNYLFAAKLNTATGWSFNKDNYWFTLGNPATVFPCAGYNDGGTSKATFRTVLWNAHHDGDHPDTAYNIYVYSGPAFANYAHGKSRGYYVRCVAE